MFHTDQADGNDTVTWILKQPWSDGRIFTVGASADGIGSLMLGFGRPKFLEAQFVIFATGSAEETFYPGGAFREGLVEGWLKSTVSESKELIQEVRDNEGPGPYWDAVEWSGGTGTTVKYDRVNWPTVHWAGWYDIFLRGQLVTFEGFQKNSQVAVRGKHWIVVDPCGHCQDAAKVWSKHLIEGRVLLPILLGVYMFTGELESKVPEGVQAVTFYVLGGQDAPAADGNYWVSLPDWPSYTPTPLFLYGDGRAGFEPSLRAGGSTEYLYDPAHPVPSYGGNNLKIACGPLDQATRPKRADELEFLGDRLTEALFLTGPLIAELYVSSSANDTDFTLKLMDVYPDGRALLVQDGIRRMRWRPDRGADGPVLIEPQRIYKVPVSLWNTSYAFAPGHRIKVTVSSSNAPRFEPNPNTGRPIASPGTQSVVARNVLYHSLLHPSALLLPVVPRSALPKHDILGTSERMAASLGEGKAAALHAAQRRLSARLSAM